MMPGRVLWLPGCAMLLLALTVRSQEEARPEPQDTLGGFHFVVAEGRTLAVLHASGEAGGSRPSSVSAAGARTSARSSDTTPHRIHEVEVDGEVYRAATPLDGPRSRIVFDPARRAFESLLPSIRLELDGDVDADAVGEALGALRVTVFERLGFAILDLPGDLHPVDAVARVRRLPGRPEASVRLRSPPLEWR